MQKPLLRALALTLFPEMFPGPLGYSLAGQALRDGIWSLKTLNYRDFTEDKHQTVDDRPYGGGTGMVLKPDIVGRAIDAAKTHLPHAQIILTTPRGEPFSQKIAQEFSQAKELIFVCGRFEGFDQRISDFYRPREISVGDYVLSGGEIPALTMLDAAVRLLDGVIGKDSAHDEESFAFGAENSCKLEYPHYTRPPLWRGLTVPDVLTSGDHAAVEAWRREQSRLITQARRPDLNEKART